MQAVRVDRLAGLSDGAPAGRTVIEMYLADTGVVDGSISEVR